MHAYRPVCFALVGLGLLAACVSDTGLNSSADAGVDSASGGSSSGDATTSETSTSSSSSSSSGGDGGGQELPNLGCNVQGTHSVFHVNADSATFDGQGQLVSWRNLVGPEVGQPDGLGRISRGSVGNMPSVNFENMRATNQDPLPNRRVRFSSVGKMVSGAFALFLVGNHRFDFSPVYDASSLGATYFFSGGLSARLQLMGRYQLANGSNEGFGALLFNDTNLPNRVGVYSDTDFPDAQHLYEVTDTLDGQDLVASLLVDGTLMPTTRHPTNRAASTGTEIILGASNRSDQMLAGSISEIVLLSQPTPQEVDCIRQRLKTKYGK